MKNYAFSIQRLSAFLVALFLLGFLFILGKPILSPLIFALFLAMLLKPMASRLERWTSNRMLSIILSICGILIPLLGILFLVGLQLSQIIGNVDQWQEPITQGLEDMFRRVAGWIGMRPEAVENWVSEHLSDFADLPAQILTAGLGSSAMVLGSILLCLIFVFFLLLYRTSFYNFFIYQFDDDNREAVIDMVRRIESVTKEYLQGLFLVIGILAVLNTTGLYLIGIELALFWGVLGAFLSIIPYVGTTLGGFLPFAYALAQYGISWQPLAVVGYYATVQTLEGNIITPRIVGKSVRLNPFVAILALVAGGALWGVAGLILAMPTVAVVKIIFSHIDLLKPVSELLRDDVYRRQNIFAEAYDENRFRLLSFFRR